MSITISGSSGIVGANGSASIPALTGGTPNTGIFFPAANTVAFSAGGVESFRANANGIFATANIIPSSSYLRNRIINGAMQIDQRNTGSAFGTSINGYTIDRFVVSQSVTGKLNGSQNYNAVTPPAGFSNYLGLQSQSAYSVLATDYYMLYQAIEGLNIADLAWGTANAKTVTLSFQIYSNLTGTFGGSITNSGATRSYPFSYTVSSVNTWTYVSVTIPGDTSGTWLTTTGVGIVVRFGLGAGSNYVTSSGAWIGANAVQPTGTVSVVGTNAATFYITGVQLEVGSNATPFERRLYGHELMLCQRYYVNFQSSTTFYGDFGNSNNYSVVNIQTPVPMRATPTFNSASSSGTFGAQLSLSNYYWSGYYIVPGAGSAASVTGPSFNAEI